MRCRIHGRYGCSDYRCRNAGGIDTPFGTSFDNAGNMGINNEGELTMGLGGGMSVDSEGDISIGGFEVSDSDSDSSSGGFDSSSGGGDW